MGAEEKAAAVPRGRSDCLFWAAWLGGLAFLVLLATLASIHDYFPADLRITHWLQREGGIPLWGGVAAFLRDLGNLPATLIWVAVTLLLLLAGRRPESVLVFSSVVPRLVQVLVKEVVERPRPAEDLVRVSEHPASFSFPSGHVVTAVTFFGLLLVLAPIVVRRPPLRLPIPGFCLFVVLGMGPASVYTGAHWPSDVLGSYVLSALYLALALRCYRRWRAAAEKTS